MSQNKAPIYEKYPLSSLLIYNVVTLLHFFLGGVGIILGYGSSWAAYLFGLVYVVFSLGQMYVVMPLIVCPNCVYYGMGSGLCTSGLSALARRIAKPGDAQSFGKRAEGLLCHNNLYMAALFVPILATIPALLLNFSVALLIVFLAVVGLLLFRFFVIFGQVACLHCCAKYDCPNAERSGVRDR